MTDYTAQAATHFVLTKHRKSKKIKIKNLVLRFKFGFWDSFMESDVSEDVCNDLTSLLFSVANFICYDNVWREQI